MSNKDIYHALLDLEGTQSIRDPIWNTIVLDASLKRVLQSKAMQKLTRIMQLGPTYLVYPGATHTRYAHSIGVYHIARRIILHLLGHAACPVLTLVQVKSFLAAALLHDIGHFPYTHSLKNLPLPSHEFLSATMIMGELAPVLEFEGINPGLAAAIIAPTIHEEDQANYYERTQGMTKTHASGKNKQSNYKLDSQDAQALALFSRLLSGPLDPDKLDYLCRDAFFAGVPYGVQDISYAIEQMSVNEAGEIKYGSMLAIENVLFSKYLMYSSVYWHKRVRAATAMIKSAIYEGLMQGKLLPEELIGLDDQSFIARCQIKNDAKGGEYMQRARMVHRGALCSMIFESDDAELINSIKGMDDIVALEQKIAQRLSLPFVVVDVPERISFEVDDVERTVFSGEIIASFVNRIRKFRVFVPEESSMRELSAESTESFAPHIHPKSNNTKTNCNASKVHIDIELIKELKE